jgi:hypothetical protein
MTSVTDEQANDCRSGLRSRVLLDYGQHSVADAVVHLPPHVVAQILLVALPQEPFVFNLTMGAFNFQQDQHPEIALDPVEQTESDRLGFRLGVQRMFGDELAHAALNQARVPLGFWDGLWI